MTKSNMKIQKITHWTLQAEQGLGETLNDDAELLKQQVNSGIAELWCIDNESWMITRVEDLPGRKPELVVCCYKGKDLNQVGDLILAQSKKQDFGSIRFHTKRKGLNRLLSKFNFQFLESIYLLNL